MYYFNLKDAESIHVDRDGTELPDDTHAREHARQVARELMERREAKTRSWRLQVCDAHRSTLFEMLFATVDRTIDGLPPALRDAVQTASARTAALSDTIVDVRMTLHQLKGTLAKSNGSPYVIAVNGRSIEP
jgi:hypothetical protein